MAEPTMLDTFTGLAGLAIGGGILTKIVDSSFPKNKKVAYEDDPSYQVKKRGYKSKTKYSRRKNRPTSKQLGNFGNVGF
jgi:hypothetical protein